MGCLSFPLFSPHMCTPLPPGVSSAFGLGKPEAFAPSACLAAGQGQRPPEPMGVMQETVMKGPQPAACISPPPYSPSNAGSVPQGVAKAPGLHKAFPVWAPRHCHQHLGSQEATGTGTACKGPCCGGLGTTACLACARIRESCTMPWGPARAAFLPSSLV